MDFRDIDKQALIENAATISSTITLVSQDITFTENDCLADWKLEDFRYVPNNGFLGQFVERLLDGNLINVPKDVVLENEKIKLSITIHNGLDNSDYTYDYGTFIITKVNKKDTTGKLSFESCDLTKLFNKTYTPGVEFPCTVIELLYDVCLQVNMLYDYDDEKTFVLIKAIGTTEVIPAGTVCFKFGELYYCFTNDSDLSLYDSIMYNPFTREITIRGHVDNEPFEKIQLPVLSETPVGTEVTLNVVVNPRNWLGNENFVVDANHFDNLQNREVIKAIAGLLYSSARIGFGDRLYFDSYNGADKTVDEHNHIDINHHYGSIASDANFGPVEKFVIGLSSVSGENVYYPDIQSDENTVELGIWDNPITYTDQLRRLSLLAVPPEIGLEYTPIEVTTTGHPWLNANDLIAIDDVDGNTFYTYPFNRTITYNGVISTKISSKGTKGTVDRDYKYDNSISKRVSNAEIVVNKAAGSITIATKAVEEFESEIDEVNNKLDDKEKELLSKFEDFTPISRTEKIETDVKTVYEDMYKKDEIQRIITGTYEDENGNKVTVTRLQTKNGIFDIDGMHYAEVDEDGNIISPTMSMINEKGLAVEIGKGKITEDGAEFDTSSPDLLYAGYVDKQKIEENASLEDFEGQTVVYSENSVVNKFFSFAGVSRLQKYSEEVEGKVRNGAGFFYIGE